MSRRFPTLLAFVTLGLFWGAWASVLPDVQRATGVSKGALGVALLCVSLGSIPAMLFVAGPAVDRYGSRAVAVFGAAFAAATTLPGLAGSLPLLALALLVAGAASGALDVGINANAGRLEAESGMPLRAMLEISDRCNEVCAHCYQVQGQKGEHDREHRIGEEQHPVQQPVVLAVHASRVPHATLLQRSSQSLVARGAGGCRGRAI